MLYQLSLFFIALLIVSPLNAQDPGKAAMLSGDQSPPLVLQSVLGAEVACVNDVAAGYPCSSVNLSSFLSIADISDALNSGSVETNDIWGWTDPETGVEYALLGMNNGTAFIDVSDAENPQPVGFLPTHTTSSIWRDIKVYNNHAFIVADAAGSHGVQIYDLTQLRSITTPQTLENTSHYDGIASAHNIAINEESGFAYVVGSRGGGQTCNSSLHMVDISNPLEPSFAGCFFDLQTGGVVAVGYTHDVQCVNYNGPDTEHAGKEICIGSNERAISIADVTDKSNPVALSRGTYPEASYIHQGWLSEDHRYFFQDDELDERNLGTTTRTIVWDLEDLDDPVIVANLDSEVSSIDHNQYVKDNVLYQSNYSSGVRIWDVRDPLNPVFAGFFDTYPSNNNTGFVGTWSNYPFFESGIVIASGIDEGLFVLNPELNLSVAVEDTEVPASMDVTPPYPNPVTQSIISLQVKSSQDDAIQVEIVDMTGRVVGTRLYKALTPNTPVNLSIDTSTLPNGNYLVRVTGNSETKVYPIAILD